jgi:hypothetical protein
MVRVDEGMSTTHSDLDGRAPGRAGWDRRRLVRLVADLVVGGVAVLLYLTIEAFSIQSAVHVVEG